MLSGAIVECGDCGIDLEPDSVFCRRCGKRVAQADLKRPPEVEELIRHIMQAAEEAGALVKETGAMWERPRDARAAIVTYLERFPNGSHAPDVRITREFFRMLDVEASIARGSLETFDADGSQLSVDALAVTG